MKRRPILVTGAAGFIGSSLVRRLAMDRPCEVRAAVRSLAPHIEQTCEQVVVGDISPGTDWRPALSGVDAVVHLAAMVHVLRVRGPNPVAAFRGMNVDATLALARQAREAGVRRFVFISTVGVNGNVTTMQPFSETDPPAPCGPYAESKREAEDGLRALARHGDMEIVIVRPPMVYGPNAPGNFGRLCGLLSRGAPVPLGTTTNLRSFVALDNLVDFITVCIDHPGATNETFLVSDDEDLSTADFIRRLAHAMRRRARLIPLPNGLLEAAATVAGRRALVLPLTRSLRIDMTLARTRLRWRPPTRVDEQLHRVAAFA